MTDKQPKALWLADELDAYHTRSAHKEAAAELRRLHNEARVLTETLQRCKEVGDATAECYRLDLERDEALLRQALVALKQGRAYVWLPCGNTKIDPIETDAAIDAARGAK